MLPASPYSGYPIIDLLSDRSLAAIAEIGGPLIQRLRHQPVPTQTYAYWESRTAVERLMQERVSVELTKAR